MPLKQPLYRVAKSVVNAIPRRLLRLRPFGVYELRPSQGQQEGTVDEASAPPATVKSIVVSLIESTEDLETLTDIAAKVNLTQWNGSNRLAAVAWQETPSGKPLPVGIAWINTESFEEPDLGLRYQLKSNEAWLHSAHVLPKLRGQGIYQKLLRFIVDTMSNEGNNRILLGVTHGNEASITAHRKLGASKLGSIHAIRSLGFSCCVNRGKVQPNGFQLGRQINITID